MFEDFKKFINSILAERTATPLFISFIIAWSIWNWEIIYLTLFVDEWRLEKSITKIDLIKPLLNWIDSFVIPFVSSMLIIFIFPFLANKTYQASIWFRRKRIDKKNEILYKDRLLTKDQGDKIRSEAQERVRWAQEEAESNIRHRKAAEEARDRLSSEVGELRQKIDFDKNKFHVVFAKYGNENSGWLDVTKTLNREIENQKGKRLKFTVKNNSFDGADPAEFFWKELLITYKYNGVYYSTSLIEGDELKLEIDPDVVYSIITRGNPYNEIVGVLNAAHKPLFKSLKSFK